MPALLNLPEHFVNTSVLVSIVILYIVPYLTV